MALFNEILEGGLNQVVVKRLGMQTGTAVPAVQPEMTTDLTLESDRPEWGFLKGEYRFSIARNLAAPGAGQHAGIKIENSPNSGVLCVIESIAANALARIGTGTSAIATVGGTGFGIRRDLRQPISSRVDWADLVTLTASLPAVQEYLFVSDQIPVTYILPPGAFLFVHRDAAASAIALSVTWRERPALPGELG